jgi:hypothetical protein
MFMRKPDKLLPSANRAVINESPEVTDTRVGVLSDRAWYWNLNSKPDKHETPKLSVTREELFMKQRNFASWGFFVAGVLSMVAALVPLLRGQSMNVTFLGVAVVCLVLGVATGRKGGGGHPDPPG